MPRLRNRRTGVVVDVPDDTAARLAGTHEPVKEKAPAKPDEPAQKPAPRRRTTTKK